MRPTLPRITLVAIVFFVVRGVANLAFDGPVL
jgi:hypothetical protein